MVGGCCVCAEEQGWDLNPLVYCDGHGCDVAVHQGNIRSIDRSIGIKQGRKRNANQSVYGRAEKPPQRVRL